VKRVNVKGISGSRKSTFAAKLAQRLELPYIELDALHHGPNWSEATAKEFRAVVREAMTSASEGWVIDVNYERKLYFRHRRQWPRRLAGDERVVRLRSVAEATAWLEQVPQPY